VADTKKTSRPAAGHRRVRVSYSPDGFRGVRDYDAEIAAIMVAEQRAAYVADDTPLGEDTPPEGEFRGPLSTQADTSASRADTPTSMSTTVSSSSTTR
jgi:hypothetical protein